MNISRAAYKALHFRSKDSHTATRLGKATVRRFLQAEIQPDRQQVIRAASKIADTTVPFD